MVYCSRCGTLNSDDAPLCSKCGAPLSVSPESEPTWRRGHYSDRREYRHQRRAGSGIGALIAGIAIILIGLGIMFPEISRVVPWWYVFLIIVGIWLLYVGIRQSRRRTSPAIITRYFHLFMSIN